MRPLHYLTLGLAASVIVAGLALTVSQQRASADVVTTSSTLRGEVGLVGFISSMSAGSRGSGVSKLTDLGAGWDREEILYSAAIDFAPYDDGIGQAKAAGLKVLALLSYPGSGTSHDDWKAYVQSAVSHLGGNVDAWEIMNEADNYLSAADYTTYLSEANEIIKATDSSATIVASGITSRAEATSFWDGIAAAGGWGKFDAIGLHVYHSGNPEKVNFGGGNLVGELTRVVSNINKNGGGKKIWITETGYKSSSEGETNQANWLARTYLMARSVSSVERIFTYRLQDTDYSLVNGDFSNKPAFDRVKEFAANVGGKGTGTRLYPQSKTTLDAFDGTTGWKTEASSNATVNLSSAGGHSGNGMKIEYSYSQDSAYAIMEKEGLSAGQPSAFAAWIYGDNTSNVWKFRFKDANGETFQTDLGSLAAEWQYLQFTIGQDTALTSWGGNGTIDYPISFNAIVVDRQGGNSSGTGIVDELVSISGDADLYAYQFDSTVAYWKVSGSASAALCGETRTFYEEPDYASVSSCDDTPTTSQSSSSSSSSSSSDSGNSSASTPAKTTTKKATTSAPARVADAEKSTVRVDGEHVLADGEASYSIVVSLKDKDSAVITSITPDLTLSGPPATLSGPTLVGEEWIWKISATVAGERVATIKAGTVELATKPTFTFDPVPVAAPETPVVEATETTTAVSPAKRALAVAGLLLLGIAGAVGWARYRRFRKLRSL